MGLFSKRKTEYHGFARYADEINRYSQNQPAQNNARAQSLTSASQAAMAALQKHQKAPGTGTNTNSVRARPQSMQKNVPGGYRANSLAGYSRPQRANSMQSYTYQYEPKASYATGPRSAVGNSPIQAQNRTMSMQKPSAPRLHSLQGGRTHSLRSNSLSGSVRSGRRAYIPPPVFAEEDEEGFSGFEGGYYAPVPENDYMQDMEDYGRGLPDGGDGDAEMVVTTKTTKVVDAAGRTRSITTETVRHMPDGTNVIETKTTNISRTGSRAGSRANSLQSGPGYGPGHANASASAPAYNLKKIEEDLQDFDYTYLDDAPPKIHDGLPSFPQKEAQSPKTAAEPAAPYTPPAHREPRANSLTSTQSPKKLKSILKSSASAATAAAAVAAQNGGSAENRHDPAERAGVEPENGYIQEQQSLRKNGPQFSPQKLQQAPDLSHAASTRLASLTSGGNSIKFRETVETIPYTYPSENRHSYQELANDEEHKKKQAIQESVDLYSKALQVATEKVYGSPKVAGTSFDPTPESPRAKEIQKLTEKKLKTDEKRSKTEASGVSKNYVYTNHHKDFSIRSLRNGDEGTHMSRKERAREEKRQAKEEEKRHAERLKAAEKQMKEDEKKHADETKTQEKSRKQEEKEAKKREKSTFSLFKRNKRKGSVGESVADSVETAAPVAEDVQLVKETNHSLDPNAQANSTSFSKEKEQKHATIPKVPVDSGAPKQSEIPAHKVEEQARDAASIPQPVQHHQEMAYSHLIPESPQQKESESLQPLKSQDLNELNEEFVDVPEDLENKGDLRPVRNVLMAGDQVDAKPEKEVSKKTSADVDAPETAILVDSNSSQATKIPEAGDLVDRSDKKLQNEHIFNSEALSSKDPVTEQTHQDLLPTLVSGANGRPEVVTSTDHHVFQPRDLNNLDDISVKDTQDAAYEDASDSLNDSAKESKLACQNQDQKYFEHLTEDNKESTPTAIFGSAPRSAAISNSPKHRSHRREFSVDQISKPIEAHKISSPAFGSGDQTDDRVLHANTAHKEADSRIPEAETGTGEKTSKKPKKQGRFKKAIEKYFLNNYSR